MTNKQLKKKIEEIVAECPAIEECNDCIARKDKLLSLCKEYALSVLPKEDEIPSLTINFPITDSDKDGVERRKLIILGVAQGRNQAIKQAKERIGKTNSK